MSSKILQRGSSSRRSRWMEGFGVQRHRREKSSLQFCILSMPDEVVPPGTSPKPPRTITGQSRTVVGILFDW